MSTSRNVKAAAAFVESFAPRDRRWLLAQLPPDTAREIETEGAALPAHLRSSGLRELLPALRGTGSVPAATLSSRKALPASFDSVLDAEDLKRLTNLDAAVVLQVLDDCPDWFCGAVLRLQDWPWQTKLLAARPAIRLHLTAPANGMKPTARAALIRSLTSHVEPIA